MLASNRMGIAQRISELAHQKITTHIATKTTASLEKKILLLFLIFYYSSLVMLSRRHLRSKALQALYAYYTGNSVDLAIGEKNLLKSTERIYELITWQLALLLQIVKFSALRLEENKKKFYPTPEDLNPNMKFINNQLIQKLRENKDLKRKISAYSVDWSQETELVRKLYNKIRTGHRFLNYMNNPTNSFEQDRDLILHIYYDFIAFNEDLEYFFEEKNAAWANDLEIAVPLAVKVIKMFSGDSDEFMMLPSLYNQADKDDINEDKKFLIDLYLKTILKSKDFEAIIQEKTKNWELSRIALMDILLLKMALTELTEFDSIPVKVTLNEYIDLSKFYSTNKSKVFINGLLDKVIAEMTADKRIVKKGRGLIDKN
jgi:transcription antitermination protein NusB